MENASVAFPSGVGFGPSDHQDAWGKMAENLPVLSKGQVNAAGLVIRDHSTPFTQETDAALNTLGTWRSTHAYPLQTVYMALRERSRRVDPNAICSQRLKRVPSIVVKLQRNHNMKLSTVQDIGGCRTVLVDVAAVKLLAGRYGEPVRDYIEQPKPDGYRSIHFVEQYQPNLEKYEVYAGRRIEVQMRTRLQHAWGTAVETVDSLLGQGLKTGKGDAEWKRFFALASSVIAHKEGCPLVPGTPDNPAELFGEIRDLAASLNVFSTLEGLTATVEGLAVFPRSATYVLELDLEKREIQPIGFDDHEQAAAFYLEQEKKYFGDPSKQIVQVSAGRVRDLKRAYPNYYLNTAAFMTAISEALK